MGRVAPLHSVHRKRAPSRERRPHPPPIHRPSTVPCAGPQRNSTHLGRLRAAAHWCARRSTPRYRPGGPAAAFAASRAGGGAVAASAFVRVSRIGREPIWLQRVSPCRSSPMWFERGGRVAHTALLKERRLALLFPLITSPSPSPVEKRGRAPPYPRVDTALTSKSAPLLSLHRAQSCLGAEARPCQTTPHTDDWSRG